MAKFSIIISIFMVMTMPILTQAQAKDISFLKGLWYGYYRMPGHLINYKILEIDSIYGDRFSAYQTEVLYINGKRNSRLMELGGTIDTLQNTLIIWKFKVAKIDGRNPFIWEGLDLDWWSTIKTIPYKIMVNGNTGGKVLVNMKIPNDIFYDYRRTDFRL